MKGLRLGLTAVAVVVLAVAILGVGMGDAPKNDPAPTGVALAASKRAIASGDAQVQKGKEEFAEEHCDTCHAIAATGAKGVLGPRMDAQDDPVGEVAENIAEPRKDIAEGFEAKLMPTDYTKRMSATEIKAVAAFVKAASTTGARDGDEG